MAIKNLSRRKFIEAGSAIGAATALAGCLKQNDPYARSQIKSPVPGSESWYRGEEKIVSSTCGQCPVNCGIRVRVVEGRAVKIMGNPESLLAGGKLGPKGQTGLFTLYDPDRIQSPLKRVGERGAGEWKKISWNEALKEVTAKLEGIRAQFEPHKLSVLCGRPRGFMKELFQRFCQSYGTPNFFDSLSTGDGALVQAMNLMTGVAELPGYDADNTSYILSLGSGIFEATCNGIHFARSSGVFKKENPTRRAKVIQVEPFYSATGRVADEWIQIKPGTYDVLALGLAHQLIKLNLHDKDFLSECSFGFDEFSALLEQYPEKKVAQITGIPEKVILRLAREMAKSKPTLVITDARSTSTSNGLNIARCALALNAVLGNFERPGGIVVKKPVPLSNWAEMVADETSKIGLSQPPIDGRNLEYPLGELNLEQWIGKIAAGKPYPTEALMLYYSNPLYSRCEGDRILEAFKKIPFIVSFSPFMDESAHYSDIILPDHTYLERWEESIPPPFGFRSAIGLRVPVVEPLYDTLHTGDVLLKIAHDLKGVTPSFPWETYKEAAEERIGGLSNANRGTIVEDNFKKFMKKLTKAGYWSDDPALSENWRHTFKTPSGKFEFFSQHAQNNLQRKAKEMEISPEEYLSARGKATLEDIFFPTEEEPFFEGAPSKFPLVLLTYKGITYAEGSGANIPALTELSGMQNGLWAHESWKSWIEINPVTASDLGISNGDKVFVESPAGRLHCYALIKDTVPKEVAVMELGKGHSQFGRFSKGIGANPIKLMAPYSHPMSGLTPRIGTRIRIEKT